MTEPDRDARGVVDRGRSERPEGAEPPPILGAWWRLYALVILELMGTIALLGWLTRRFG